MKERPIIFKSEMVRAILEGRKTQTRRLKGLELVNEDAASWKIVWQGMQESDSKYGAQFDRPRETVWIPATMQPGDRLWVKETYRVRGKHTDSYKAVDVVLNPSHFEIAYQADIKWSDHIYGKIRPSIFMPRQLSRITLEITAVRVERLRDISEADAIAEGVERDAMCGPVSWYEMLWNKINGNGSWDKNPWVWVYEFKKI